MNTTAHLSLPMIAAAQSQKHEMRGLDALVDTEVA